MSVSVSFVPNVVVQHVNFFVVCCVETESSILLIGDVAYDARFSVCNKRYTLRYSHRTYYSPFCNVVVEINVFPDFLAKIIVTKQ